MKKREIVQYAYEIFKGILATHSEFDTSLEKGNICYDFTSKEYAILKSKYKIEKIAGNGSEFTKAKRLVANFAHRLNHNVFYDNHIDTNSIALLEYSLDNENHGINCLNKSKIIVECLLALGIYSRRVKMYPYSPYDIDNHVVVELFDATLNKWIMIDPSQSAYMIDDDWMPLSISEYRYKLAYRHPTSAISITQKHSGDFSDLLEKNEDINFYYSKNMVHFELEAINCFGGDHWGTLHIWPKGFDCKKYFMLNYGYRIDYAKKSHCFSDDLISKMEAKLKTIKRKEFINFSIDTFNDIPSRSVLQKS
jgi:hypothetical protein